MYPDAQIDMLVRPGTDRILKGAQELVDHIYLTPRKRKGLGKFSELWENIRLCWQLQSQHYDWAIELSDNDRGRLMAWLSGATNRAAHCLHNFKAPYRSLFNHLSEFEYYGVHRCHKDVQLLREFLDYNGLTHAMVYDPKFADTLWVDTRFRGRSDLILLNPYSGMPHKEWNPDRWVGLAQKLSKFGPVIFCCGPDETQIESSRAMAEATENPNITYAESGLRWPELAGVLLRTKLLVTVDTGVLHLAAACKTPTVALFGPTPEQEWGPFQTRHLVVTPPGPRPKDIHDRRMEFITTDAVLEACGRMIK